jgi:hypothetical protein
MSDIRVLHLGGSCWGPLLITSDYHRRWLGSRVAADEGMGLKCSTLRTLSQSYGSSTEDIPISVRCITPRETVLLVIAVATKRVGKAAGGLIRSLLPWWLSFGPGPMVLFE